jgi:soluble lytic murein transglycosylase-like protein
MTTARRALEAHQFVVRRLLGFGVLLLIIVSGYVASHRRVANEVPPTATNAPAPTIESHIREAASQYAVSEDLVTAVIEVESQFNAHAVSHRGAQGLMQLMPATAASLGVRNAFDPRDNIHGGVRHLRWLMDRFDHDLPVVLAAYNAGEGAVLKNRGVPPSRETREYVKRVMQRMNRDRAKS